MLNQDEWELSGEIDFVQPDTVHWHHDSQQFKTWDHDFQSLSKYPIARRKPVVPECKADNPFAPPEYDPDDVKFTEADKPAAKCSVTVSEPLGSTRPLRRPEHPTQWTEGTPGDGVWVVRHNTTKANYSYDVIEVDGNRWRYELGQSRDDVWIGSDEKLNITHYAPFTPPQKPEPKEELEPLKLRKVLHDGKEWWAKQFGTVPDMWTIMRNDSPFRTRETSDLTFLDKEPT